MPSPVDPGRFGLSLVAGIVSVVVLHVALSWPFTVVGGAIGGFLAGRYGWVSGLLAGGLSWGGLALWSRSVDSRAVDEMLRVVGTLLGLAAPWAVLLLTAALGALLGASGGWVGSNVRNLLGRVRR